jgi:hypothetical protein
MAKDSRFRRIAGLDILPYKPCQGWNDLQLDEALRRPELFRGNRELYAAVRCEAIKRGLGGEEDYVANPFPKTDIGERRETAGTGLPFLMDERRRRAKHERRDRKRRLVELLMETQGKKTAGSLDRLLRLAAAMEDSGADTSAFDRQFDLYLRRGMERMAHMVPSKETNTPPMWKRNLDYSPEEGSPYFGSVSDFLKRFPGGIAEWRKWRGKTRKQRERQHRIAALMPDTGGDAELEAFLREAWALEDGRSVLAHFVPEGGDDVAELGDKEPKLWSDSPEWKSVDEFLKAHRGKYGQEADDAALKAARDFVRYWRQTLKRPKGARGK